MKKRRIIDCVKAFGKFIPGGKNLFSMLNQLRERLRKARDCKILQESGPDLLRLVHSRLCGKVPYFIDYGTLLGCVREGAFLKHDDDIDFGIMPGGDIKLLIELLEDSELKYVGSYVYNNQVMEVGYRFRKMRVDFFVNKEKDGCFLADAYYDIPGVSYDENQTGCYRFIRPKVNRLEERNFLGVKVNIPTNYDELLTAHYGANWRNPDPHWTATDGDGRYHRILMPGTCRICVPKDEAVAMCK